MKRRFLRVAVILVICYGMSFIACGDDCPVCPGTGPAPLSFESFQAADIVIGQPHLNTGAANSGGSTNDTGLSDPYGNPAQGSFYVPDQVNNRVLGFDSMPVANGVSADFVLGQPDFTSNVGGTTASSFRFPSDCVVADGKLFVVDNANNRVLLWNTLPKADTSADIVIGQPDFTTSSFGTSASTLFRPYDAAVAGNRLFLVDFHNNRVMIWNSVPAVSGQPADVVVGQPGFTSSAAGSLATELDAPVGVWASSSRLAIADRSNRRVLIYNSIPTANGAAADVVVGAPDFGVEGASEPRATTIGSPYGVASDGRSLFVADDGYHRVLIYPFPTANEAPATRVLGQSSFMLGAFNDANQDGMPDGVVSARTFFDPTGVVVIGRRLIVTDQDNHRMMVFNSH